MGWDMKGYDFLALRDGVHGEEDFAWKALNKKRTFRFVALSLFQIGLFFFFLVWVDGVRVERGTEDIDYPMDRVKGEGGLKDQKGVFHCFHMCCLVSVAFVGWEDGRD